MSTQEPTRRSTGRRVGAEERQTCAEVLSHHHAHGRLSQGEFEERLGTALTAQRVGDLGHLLTDLPIRGVEEPTGSALDAHSGAIEERSETTDELTRLRQQTRVRRRKLITGGVVTAGSIRSRGSSSTRLPTTRLWSSRSS